MTEPTFAELVALIDRTQKSIAEEGTLAHRVDDLAAVIRPDGRIFLRFVAPSTESHEVFEKAIRLDPEFERDSADYPPEGASE